ncbi:MAG TPA: hypothetical protein VJK66_04800 [Gaiellaceae bacterium]|nr:hypothetical protein [Gaiellaceae bacterium]
MIPRRTYVLFAAAALALVALAPAAAKEGVQATLDSPAALRGAPGDTISVGWTLGGIDGGERYAFNAEGIFLRLLDASGGEPVTAFAEQGPIGHYVAEATLPAGGLGGVQIGLLGTVERDGVSKPSEVFFPVVNDPFREEASRAGAPASAAPSGGSAFPAWAIALAAAGGALALLAAARLAARAAASSQASAGRSSKGLPSGVLRARK